MTGVTSGLAHLIASVRQVGFPRLGAEMEIVQVASRECSQEQQLQEEGKQGWQWQWGPQPIPGEL